MAPPHLTTLAKRLNFSINNPIADRNFITMVIGLVVGAILFLTIVTLILCLYRENSPLKRCCGRRFRKRTEKPPPPHLKAFKLGVDSQTSLVGAAVPMGQVYRGDEWVDRERVGQSGLRSQR